MSADRLLAQVWHDLDQPKLSSLHVAISKLRDLLSPDRARREDGVLVRDGSRYLLSAARGSVDVARFEELVRTGAEVAETSADAAAAAYLEALSLWRGSPYADIAGSEFTTPEIARLTAMHLETRRSLLEVGLRRERFAEVAAEAEALAAEHPLDERIWEILVLALYRGGRQSDALGALRRIRAILDDELGIDPGVALRRLEAAVLAQDAALHGQAAPRPAQPDPPRAPNLPSPRSLLVGRAADIESVATALGEHPLVTLVGPGGVGKTRLAIEVARRRRAADGPWMVDLGALTDGALMVPAVASALGLPGVGGAEHLAGVLAGRTMLMILDNCEHVVADAAALAVTLADLCPGVQLLATSREPLEVDGEALHEVPPLAPDEARDLFAAREGGVVPGWALGEANVASVRTICAELDGIPLGIELATAQLRVLSEQQIADGLEDRFTLLRGGSRSAPPRQRRLADTIDWSYRLLDDEQAVVLRQVAVFAGSFDIDGAAAVTGAPSAVASVQPLTALVRRSLLTVLPGTAPRRYRMLRTIKHFAWQQSDPAERRSPPASPRSTARIRRR
ncbi:putative ATPase/DNA-binding SARP family transcriptional activator [Rhodococcus sp. PvR044]|uniref:ATP-binding protein n=1 Tax=Rhodococcus sp. PvR044 TaxID=3156402 RepID=UPI003396A15D